MLGFAMHLVIIIYIVIAIAEMMLTRASDSGYIAWTNRRIINSFCICTCNTCYM